MEETLIKTYKCPPASEVTLLWTFKSLQTGQWLRLKHLNSSGQGSFKHLNPWSQGRRSHEKKSKTSALLVSWLKFFNISRHTDTHGKLTARPTASLSSSSSSESDMTMGEPEARNRFLGEERVEGMSGIMSSVVSGPAPNWTLTRDPGSSGIIGNI